MTHMLAGLANGRMVVALEVRLTTEASDSQFDHISPQGWIQSRLNLGVCTGCDQGIIG